MNSLTWSSAQAKIIFFVLIFHVLLLCLLFNYCQTAVFISLEHAKPLVIQELLIEAPPPMKVKLAQAPRSKITASRDLSAKKTPSKAPVPQKKANLHLLNAKNAFESKGEGVVKPSSLHVIEGDEKKIARIIRRFLSLPEKGEVLIELFIQPNGEVEQVRILNEKSQINARYIMDVLPSVRFPQIGKNKVTKYQVRLTDENTS